MSQKKSERNVDLDATQSLTIKHHKHLKRPVFISLIVIATMIVCAIGFTMAQSLQQDDGLARDADGNILSGFIDEEDGVHYYDAGVKLYGLTNTYAKVTINGTEQISYFDEEGMMVTGEYTIDGVSKLFDDNGALIVDTEYLKNGVQEILNEYEGDISVYYKDLNSDLTFSINDEETYYPCSIIKLAALMSTYNAFNNGSLTSNEEIQEWITDMITVSDNTSFNSLIVAIGGGDGAAGAEITNSYIQELGCTRTEIVHSLEPGTNLWRIGDSNYSCASEIGLLLEKLYREETITPEACEEMIEILKTCEDDTKIQSGLPEDVEYAHKTGWDGDNYHDGGIVYVPQGDYILVIFSEGTYYSDMMQRVSEFIYDYQSNLYPADLLS